MKLPQSHIDIPKLSWKQKLLLALGGTAVAGGVVFLGIRVYRRKRANKEEKKTFEQGTPATWAKQIKMAFENDGWPGTDTVLLRKVFRAIPTREQVAEVSKSYNKLYSSNLMRDMSGELQSTEYTELLQIIATKPSKKGAVDKQARFTGWAKRLKAAFDKSYGPFPGTDEDAIKAVFLEIPTQADFIQTGRTYKGLYGNNLMTDLKGELEFWEFDDYMSIILKKPKA